MFGDEVVKMFGDGYFRAPTEVDLRCILRISPVRVFLGNVGG